jgi:hypothetical protein
LCLLNALCKPRALVQVQFDFLLSLCAPVSVSRISRVLAMGISLWNGGLPAESVGALRTNQALGRSPQPNGPAQLHRTSSTAVASLVDAARKA